MGDFELAIEDLIGKNVKLTTIEDEVFVGRMYYYSGIDTSSGQLEIEILFDDYSSSFVKDEIKSIELVGE